MNPTSPLDTAQPPSRTLAVAVLLLVLIGTIGGIFGGPELGDHEALVAQCARDMRLSGDWIIPRFSDTAFIRKPPLPYWLIAASSHLLPNDPQTGLPVTTQCARLPSALAAFGTVLLLWRLGSFMFGRRTGLVTAVIGGSSLYFLQYGANVTAEMLLTFCCTWAFLHFWYAVTARRPSRRCLHLFFFYVALGFGMLAKGPAPIPMVAMPLAVWWYAERPLRVLARGGPTSIRRTLACFVRHLWPRTRHVFTKLWIIPGLVVFAMLFVPWMMAVAAKHDQAWSVWNWQYFQRAQGNYEDTRDRGILYYLPIIVGYVAPWTFLVFEAAIAPWLKRHARRHRALLYAGLWALVSFTVMSIMTFKKPYYVGPAIPGLILLMAATANRVFSWSPRSSLGAWAIWGAGVLIAVVGLVAGRIWLTQEFADFATTLTVLGVVAIASLLAAGAVYVRGRGWIAFGLVALTSLGTFHTVWYGVGPTLGSMAKVRDLAAAIERLDVPPSTTVMWADQRPDSRLAFYCNIRTAYMLTPAEIVSRMVDRSSGKNRLRLMALNRATALLSGPDPAYLIVERKYFKHWESEVSAYASVLATIECDPRSKEKDWLILSNVPLPRSTPQ